MAITPTAIHTPVSLWISGRASIFMPLNLVTGFFGMNFDTLPLIHSDTGVWIAAGVMATIGLGLGLFFWRKRYLSTRG